MYVYVYSALTVIIPVLFTLPLIRIGKITSPAWILAFLCFISVEVCFWQNGAWLYIGYPLRIIIPVLCIASVGIIKWKQDKQASASRKHHVAISISILFLAVSMYINIDSAQGRKSAVAPIELAYPFAHGSYAIMQGGNDLIGNIAHRSRIPESFAYDIVALNAYGSRASGLFSRDVEDYVIYGDTIVSPCDCTVIRSKDGTPDNIPPHMETEDRGGNLVFLKKDDITILICHMKPHSAMVSNGQQLRTGDPIGLAGNTGFSIEPHVHIQAYRKSIYGKDQVPISFQGRVLRMNDRFTVK